MNRLKSLNFLHILKDAKRQARRQLLASASDELIKAITEIALHKLNGNNKLSKADKSKLSKYKSRLCALIHPKSFP
jgi:hypothetical protein